MKINTELKPVKLSMPREYQLEYAANRPQMYDDKSRVLKAKRILLLLKDYFKKAGISHLTILDIGGSTGIIANELAKKTKKVIVTDIDKGAIKFASKKFKGKNLVFKYADAMEMPFKDNLFDVVICTHVYEHVPSPKLLFSEIFRILKPQGICYLAAQNKLWPMEAHHNLPFLSYLPKKLADVYIKIKGKDEYYEHPMSYWDLKKTLKKFTIHEYTEKILSSPEKYGYQNYPIPNFISQILKYLTPTMFWVLEK